MPAHHAVDALPDAALALLQAASQALAMLRAQEPGSDVVRANLREAIEGVSAALAGTVGSAVAAFRLDCT